MTDKTPEQVAADVAAAAKVKADAAKVKADAAAKKKADAAKVKADAAAKKKADAKVKADAKAKKKADAKVVADQKKADAKVVADQKKADAKAKKEAERMPEQNGIRRPKPATLGGQVWGQADQLSAKLGQPVSISDLMDACMLLNHNPGNVKAEYASWRKFNGVSGRVAAPKPPEAVTPEPAAVA